MNRVQAFQRNCSCRIICPYFGQRLFAHEFLAVGFKILISDAQSTQLKIEQTRNDRSPCSIVQGAGVYVLVDRTPYVFSLAVVVEGLLPFFRVNISRLSSTRGLRKGHERMGDIEMRLCK